MFGINIEHDLGRCGEGVGFGLGEAADQRDDNAVGGVCQFEGGLE